MEFLYSIKSPEALSRLIRVLYLEILTVREADHLLLIWRPRKSPLSRMANNKLLSLPKRQRGCGSAQESQAQCACNKNAASYNKSKEFNKISEDDHVGSKELDTIEFNFKEEDYKNYKLEILKRGRRSDLDMMTKQRSIQLKSIKSESKQENQIGGINPTKRLSTLK